MSRKLIKPIIGSLVVGATITAFIIYFRNNPDTFSRLGDVPLTTLGLLLLLYGIFMGTLVWIQNATLSLCDLRLGRKENMLLVMYSSIINFFGPLQSGPAFRAVYLKKRHNVKLKNYALATMLQYVFYATFSGLFLLTYFVGLWAIFAIVAIVIIAPIIFKSRQLVPARFRHLKLEHIGNLAAAVLAQVSIFAVIFYVELNSFGQHVAAVPSLIYTGAANFALFVSLTPGAIGFREAFVVFTQELHHISDSLIVAASLVDRGVYIVMLLILAVIVFGLHADTYLRPDTKKDHI